MTFSQKYSSLLIGITFLILGSLTYFRIWNDLSRSAGMAQMIVGSLLIGYHFLKRK